MIDKITVMTSSDFSLPVYKEGLISVSLAPKEEATFDVEVGAEVTITFKVKSITREET